MVIATPKVSVLFIDSSITTTAIPYYVLYYDKLGPYKVSVKIEELMVDISQDLKEQEDDGVYELR